MALYKHFSYLPLLIVKAEDVTLQPVRRVYNYAETNTMLIQYKDNKRPGIHFHLIRVSKYELMFLSKEEITGYLIDSNSNRTVRERTLYQKRQRALLEETAEESEILQI